MSKVKNKNPATSLRRAHPKKKDIVNRVTSASNDLLMVIGAIDNIDEMSERIEKSVAERSSKVSSPAETEK